MDITDAVFVDVIHTNGGEILEGEIAFYEALGHVDFYVNGGHKQPGCEKPDNSKNFLIESLDQHVDQIKSRALLIVCVYSLLSSLSRR